MAPADSEALLVQGLLCGMSCVANPRVLCRKGQSIIESARCEQLALQVNGAGGAPADSKDQVWPLACSNHSLFLGVPCIPLLHALGLALEWPAAGPEAAGAPVHMRPSDEKQGFTI